MPSGTVKQILKQYIKNKNMYISYYLRITETVQRTHIIYATSNLDTSKFC